MKKIMAGLIAIVFITNTLHAQKDNTDIDIVQAVFGKSKRLIINDYMQLDDKEKNSFWHVYDEYEEKRKVIEKESLVLLKEYADNYETMSDTEARKLIVSFMKNMDEYNVLRKVYFRKMEKVVGSLKAATFIQLEAFIQIGSQANLQSQIPVIGELEELGLGTVEPKMEN